MTEPVVREFAVVVGIGLAGLLVAGLVAFVPWYGERTGLAGVEAPPEPTPTSTVSR